MSSNKGALVWVEVEMRENFRALDTVVILLDTVDTVVILLDTVDTVVILLSDNTGATGTICRRELLGWPGPKTEIREMEGPPVVIGIWK